MPAAPIRAPDATRSFPPRAADERALLDGWLNYYRATVLHKCGRAVGVGLSPHQLVHRSCPPSNVSSGRCARCGSTTPPPQRRVMNVGGDLQPALTRP